MSGFSKRLVLKGKEFIRKYPVNLSAENTDHFRVNLKYTCPDLFVYFFNRVSFLPDSTLFLYRFWPLSLSFLFYKKRIRHHSIKGIIDIQRSWNKVIFEQRDKPYLIIHDAWTANYYHWMTQALPRLLLAQRTNSLFNLILPKSHLTEFHIKSLSILGVHDWINIDVDDTYYHASKVMYPSHDIQVGDYHDDLIRELALKLNEEKAPAPHRDFIFVHRISREGRRIVNEDEVLNVFMSYGFKVVNFEKLSFEEQRSTAGSASILAAVHGAGLTNMLFMPKGSKVLELTPILNGEQYYYYTLSNALGHDYYYQACKPETEGQTIQQSNLIIDVAELKHTLELMTKQND
jgi:hypothetical protein